MATAASSLSRWERAGVMGYGLSLVQRPLTRFAEQTDLSPPGRGEQDRGQADSIKDHLALGFDPTGSPMCNLYSITTNQAAIIALFRVINRYVGNLPPMPGVFPDYPAPVIRNTGDGREMTLMRWGMPPPPRTGGPPVTNIRNTSSPQ